MIAIHGGGFLTGDRKGGDVAPMVEATNYGYAVVSVDYRLSNEAVFPAAISDVKAAIRFIKAKAEKYDLNPDKIAVWGGSAGGHLTALVGTTGDDEILNGDNKENLEYRSAVNAVVDWFGPIDFLSMDSQYETSGVKRLSGQTGTDDSAETKYIGGNIIKNITQTQKANATNYITPSDPPFFIQHGSVDSLVPTQQSINFAEALTKVLGGDKVTLEIIQGADHGTSEFNTKENIEKVITFLDKYLK